jgi:peptidoglycan/LPS O-acetylase OafA/YrhL
MVLLVHSIDASQHLAVGNRFAGTVADLLHIPISGRAPVILFFVLSGFVLTHSILGTKPEPWRTVTFYVHRLFRIMPMALLGLPLMIVAAEFARRVIPAWETQLPLSGLMADRLEQARWVNLPAGLVLWDNVVNPAYWTLHVEVVGSLLMPMLIWLTLLGRGLTRFEVLLLLVIAGLALPFVPIGPTPLGAVTSMTIFCFPLGVLAYFIYSAGLRYHAVQALIAVLVLVFAHAVVGPYGYAAPLLGNLTLLEPIMGSYHNIALYLQHFLEGLSAAVLVGALAAVPSPPRFLSTRFATFIGKISYSLYIVHLPILCISVGLYYLLDGQVILGISPVLIIFIGPAVVFILSMLLAWLTYNVVEKPGNEIGKRFKGFSQRSRIVAAPNASGSR